MNTNCNDPESQGLEKQMHQLRQLMEVPQDSDRRHNIKQHLLAKHRAQQVEKKESWFAGFLDLWRPPAPLGSLALVLITAFCLQQAWLFLNQERTPNRIENDGAIITTSEITELEDPNKENLTVGQGEVVALGGLVEAQFSKNSAWQTITIDETLTQGTRIRTGEKSSITIKLPNQSEVRLSENTAITINELKNAQHENSAVIALTHESGDAYHRVVSPDGQQTDYRVTTPDITLQALGTAFVSAIDQASGTTTAIAILHSIQVENQQTSVQLEQGTELNADQADQALEGQKISDEHLNSPWMQQNRLRDQELGYELGALHTPVAITPPQPVTPAQPIETPPIQPEASNPIPLTPAQLTITPVNRTSVRLDWQVPANIQIPAGFVIVRGISPDPVYLQDSSIYISDSSTRSYAWVNLESATTYHFRICYYRSLEVCDSYSNSVTIRPGDSNQDQAIPSLEPSEQGQPSTP